MHSDFKRFQTKKTSFPTSGMCFQILSPSILDLSGDDFYCQDFHFFRRGLGEMHPKMLFGMSSLWTGAFAPTICMDLQRRDPPFLRAFVPTNLNETPASPTFASQISLPMCFVMLRDFVGFEPTISSSGYFHLAHLTKIYSSEFLASRVLDGHWKGRIHNRHLRIQLFTPSDKVRNQNEEINISSCSDFFYKIHFLGLQLPQATAPLPVASPAKEHPPTDTSPGSRRVSPVASMPVGVTVTRS